MSAKQEFQEIFSKKMRAGRRTYFFDVRSTKAGDYYMTITESIKVNHENEMPSYRKHKIQLYKEDFKKFKKSFEEVSNYIILEKGEEIISDKKFENKEKKDFSEVKEEPSTTFTEVSFDDLGKD